MSTEDLDDEDKARLEAILADKRTEKLGRLWSHLDQVIRILDPEPKRDGLLETPLRAAKAWLDWTAGYEVEDPGTLLKTFEDGAEGCGDELVIVRGVEFYSHCEHHLAPFFGQATVAYIPDKRVVGLSKLARVVDAYAKRLQVQERMTNQIADCIHETLQPIGVGVLVEATHLCMCSRGVSKQHSTTVTSALRGAMRDKPEVRAEFLMLAKP